MGTRMKTTIELPDPLFQSARQLAQESHSTLRALRDGQTLLAKDRNFERIAEKTELQLVAANWKAGFIPTN